MSMQCILPPSDFAALANKTWTVVRVKQYLEGGSPSSYELRLESRWLFWTATCTVTIWPGRMNIAYRHQYVVDFPGASIRPTVSGGCVRLQGVSLSNGEQRDLEIRFSPADSEIAQHIKMAADFLESNRA